MTDVFVITHTRDMRAGFSNTEPRLVTEIETVASTKEKVNQYFDEILARYPAREDAIFKASRGLDRIEVRKRNGNHWDWLYTYEVQQRTVDAPLHP